MIKYANIKGYTNIGEVQLFSHLYQFREENKELPKIILIRAYDGDIKIFKGYIFDKTKTYESIPLIDLELSEIEKYTGHAKQFDFNEFIIGTVIEDYYKNYVTK